MTERYEGQATVLMSGGIDSAACAHLLADQGLPVRGVFIDYGQAAAVYERRAAEALADYLHVNLGTYVISGDARFAAGELIGRNAFLVFSALFLGRCHSGVLAIGIHAGTPYFDCSPAFVDSMARLVAEHTNGKVKLVAPFVDWGKPDVFQYFLSAKLPVSLTYSCESGSDPPCGLCASCRDRKALGC